MTYLAQGGGAVGGRDTMGLSVMGDLYACAAMAQADGATTTEMTCCLVRAASWHEAFGKGHRLAEAKFPVLRYPGGYKLLVNAVVLEPDPLASDAADD